MSKGIGKVIAGIVTLVIGGTAYTVSQGDIVKNFSKDTGLSEQEAEQYIENIAEDELVSFDELGSSTIIQGQDALDIAAEIDCVLYEYEWETDTLSCEEGKSQFIKFGESEIALGEGYKTLISDTASSADILKVINLIEEVNENYRLEIFTVIFDYSEIDEAIKTNLYNKALLQAAFDSD